MMKLFLITVMAMLALHNAKAIEINLKEEIKMEEKIMELIKSDIKLGEGREAEKGLSVTVHYTGWLHDAKAKDGKGEKFDSSLDRREPFKFILGVGQVIQGWDEGVNGMKIGGQRLITIPADMGYGSRGAGGVIPPDADLIFDVQLLGID
jgi:FKBP-type peptidyl-prolyl cis-trans isomerase FkpA